MDESHPKHLIKSKVAATLRAAYIIFSFLSYFQNEKEENDSEQKESKTKYSTNGSYYINHDSFCFLSYLSVSDRK